MHEFSFSAILVADAFLASLSCCFWSQLWRSCSRWSRSESYFFRLLSGGWPKICSLLEQTAVGPLFFATERVKKAKRVELADEFLDNFAPIACLKVGELVIPPQVYQFSPIIYAIVFAIVAAAVHHKKKRNRVADVKLKPTLRELLFDFLLSLGLAVAMGTFQSIDVDLITVEPSYRMIWLLWCGIVVSAFWIFFFRRDLF